MRNSTTTASREKEENVRTVSNRERSRNSCTTDFFSSLKSSENTSSFEIRTEGFVNVQRQVSSHQLSNFHFDVFENVLRDKLKIVYSTDKKANLHELKDCEEKLEA